MHAKHLLIWLASVLLATAIEFPTTIELDVVFPRNETYNRMMALPVAFAVQNAEAAFQFGYSMTWTVETLGSGNVRQQPEQTVPAEAVNNTWYEWGNVTAFDEDQPIEPGTYNLTVSFIMGSCTDTSTTVTVGVTILEASVEFTVADDGTGKDVDLTSDCPRFLDTLTIERLTGPVAATASCPVRAQREPDNISDPCHARMSGSMAERVMGNLTVSGSSTGGDSSGGADQEEPPDDDPTPESTNDTSEAGTDAGSNEAENAGIRQYGPTVATAMLVSIVALFCLW